MQALIETPTAEELIGLRVLSLVQPWATFIVTGLKHYETRSWATPYRGLILIHASKKTDRRYLARVDVSRLALDAGISSFPNGVLLGSAEVTGCVASEEMADLVTEQERLVGDFTDGRFAWSLRNATQWTEPVPCLGSLGIWTVAAKHLGNQGR